MNSGGSFNPNNSSKVSNTLSTMPSNVNTAASTPTNIGNSPAESVDLDSVIHRLLDGTAHVH